MVSAINLNELPHNGKHINWYESEGHSVYFKDDYNIYEIKILRYTGKKIKVQYKNNITEIATGLFRNGNIGNVIGTKTSAYKFKIDQNINDVDRNITIIERGRINKKKAYKYRCNKCGFECGRHYSIKDKKVKSELWIEESNLLRNKGCPCCCSGSKIVVEEINSIYAQAKYDDKAKAMIKYFINKDDAKIYTPQSNQYLHFKCPYCNTETSQAVKLEHVYSCDSIGCKNCGDGISYPNKFMFSLLIQLEVRFKTEYGPAWCKVGEDNTQRYYDFYFELKGCKYIIEMDGHHHLKQKNKLIDKEKDKLANDKGIKVIRINCQYKDINSRFKFIKNQIEKSELKKVLDLKKVDFIRCDKDGCSDLVKVASEIKKMDKDKSTKDIAGEMGRSQSTIVRWLKIGNELGLCDYDPYEEQKNRILKSNATNAKKLSKRVKWNEKNLVFESLVVLCKQAEEMFGIKLTRSNVSLVCTGKRAKHKGYTFEYVE